MIPYPAIAFAAALFYLAPLSSAEAGAPQVPDAEMRLLDGGPEGEAQRLAGVRIRIDEGWKTYWRHPGDSGRAPNFDFSASTNVADIDILRPAPTIRRDRYGWVFGYEREVVFPIIVTPEDADLPVELVLDLDYAICAEICIPLQAEDGRRLGQGPERAVIEFYRDSVPVAVELADVPRVLEVRRIASEDGPKLELAVDMDGATNPRLVVEGPASWLFTVPQLAGQTADGTAIFEAPVDEVVPTDSQGEVELTVTGMARGLAFQQRVILP